MIKVYQEKADDCFRACIASMLECSINLIPNFMVDGPDSFSDNWVEWEKNKPFHFIDFKLSDLTVGWAKDTIMIATGKSPRGGYNHCVLWKDGELVHDPHLSKIGIEGAPEFYTLLFLKNPAIPFCPVCFSEMVKSRIKCVDGSGFMFGWLCDCTEETRGTWEADEQYGI